MIYYKNLRIRRMIQLLYFTQNSNTYNLTSLSETIYKFRWNIKSKFSRTSDRWNSEGRAAEASQEPASSYDTVIRFLQEDDNGKKWLWKL